MTRPTTTKRSLTLIVALGLAGCSDPTSPDLEFQRAALNGLDLVQVERFGLPAIATVFIASAKRDMYNQAAPAGDPATFGPDVVAVLTAFGHPDPSALAGALLPDIQPLNTAVPSGFLNGRRLQDDVIDAELGLIFPTVPALQSDNVDGNDAAVQSQFPYLAAPHLP
jgi:hypothetical protein